MLRGILPQAVGEAGHGVEPAPVDGEGAHAVEGRGLAIDGAGGRPGGAPGELILADLIGGQRGGPRGAAEERGEMGDPAAGGGAGFQPPTRASSDSCNNAVDHGTACQSWPPEDWAYRRSVQLAFIRPGQPVENACIESFHARRRDECLNVNQFTSLEDAWAKIEAWPCDDNQRRPHNSLGHLIE